MTRGTPARIRLLAVLALTLATAVWGSSFFLAKQVVTRHDPVTVLALRFGIGAIVMVLLRPGCLSGLSRAFWLRALGLGAVYGAAQLPHYYGLREVPASTAGFLVGVYVVLTPVLDYLLFRRRSTPRTVAGVALAAGGLAVFAWAGDGSRTGLVLCLLAAAVYALQISLLGAWSPAHDAYAFTLLQLATVAVLAASTAVLTGPDLPTATSDWLVIVYLAVVVGIIGIGVQTWAQHRVPASHAAVVMAAEPLWAAALAVAFTAETTTTRLLVGGALLLVANAVIATSAGTPPPPTVPPTASAPVVPEEDRCELEQPEDDGPDAERGGRTTVAPPGAAPRPGPAAPRTREDPERQRHGERQSGQ